MPRSRRPQWSFEKNSCNMRAAFVAGELLSEIRTTQQQRCLHHRRLGHVRRRQDVTVARPNMRLSDGTISRVEYNM